MATQQYGYGPNVWATAKPLGAQQYARLQQPGGATPTFKAENKYKALAAKAIGEMAYGAMMNQEAKKEQAAKEAELKAFNEKNAKMNAQRRQTFDVGFSPSIAMNSNEVKNEEKEEEKESKNDTKPEIQASKINNKKYTTEIFPIFGESRIFGNWFDKENYNIFK